MFEYTTGSLHWYSWMHCSVGSGDDDDDDDDDGVCVCVCVCVCIYGILILYLPVFHIQKKKEYTFYLFWDHDENTQTQ